MLTVNKKTEIERYNEISDYFIGCCTIEFVQYLRNTIEDSMLLRMFSMQDNEIETAKYIEEQFLVLLQTNLEQYAENSKEGNCISVIENMMQSKKKKWEQEYYFTASNYTASTTKLAQHINMLDLLFNIEKLGYNLYVVNNENYEVKSNYANLHRQELDYDFLYFDTVNMVLSLKVIKQQPNTIEIDYISLWNRLIYYSYYNLKHSYDIKK